MGRLLTLLASRLLLLLLLTLLSGEVFTAKLVSVHLTLLAWLLLLAIRIGTVVLVLGGIVHFSLRCSHLLPTHNGPQPVTQPCPIGTSMNKRHEQVAASKGVQCSSKRRRTWNARGTRISLTSNVNSRIGDWHSTLVRYPPLASAMKLTRSSDSHVTSTPETRTEHAQNGWTTSRADLRPDPVSVVTLAQRKSQVNAGRASLAPRSFLPARLRRSLLA